MIRDGGNIKYLRVMSAGTLSAGRFIEFVPGNNSNDRCTLQQKFRDDSFIGDYSRSNIRASLISKRAFCTINGKCCPINRRSNRRCRSMYSVGMDSAIHDLFEYSFCWWTRGFKNSPRAGNMSGALFVASMRLRRDFAPHGFATIAGLPHCNSRIVALQQEQGIFCLCKTVSSYSLSLQSIRQASDERATCRICF